MEIYDKGIYDWHDQKPFAPNPTIGASQKPASWRLTSRNSKSPNYYEPPDQQHPQRRQLQTLCNPHKLWPTLLHGREIHWVFVFFQDAGRHVAEFSENEILDETPLIEKLESIRHDVDLIMADVKQADLHRSMSDGRISSLKSAVHGMRLVASELEEPAKKTLQLQSRRAEAD